MEYWRILAYIPSSAVYHNGVSHTARRMAELYELILYDDSLSVPMRKNVLGRVSAQYSNDTTLVNMIYPYVDRF